jgi:catechol 2,3-dioxygenase-like lactoylglutathione lyase family enzyme
VNLEARDLWHARPVFFAKDAQSALSFYTDKLGCSLDWNYEHEGRAFVFQVNLHGIELIVNQVEDWTEARPGHGRIFIGLDDDQVQGFWEHLKKHSIETTVKHWGEPTVAIYDLDGNELFFWLSEQEREKLRAGMDSAA